MFGKQAFTPLPGNMELSVSISVKPLSSTLPDNMNNTVNFANRICPVSYLLLLLFYLLPTIEQTGKPCLQYQLAKIHIQ